MNQAAAKSKNGWLRAGPIAAIAFTVIVGLIGLAIYFNPVAVLHRRSHRFFLNVQRDINVEDLRIWAFGIASKHAFESKPSVSEIPSALLKLSERPPSVLVCSTNASSEHPYVMLIYGGGFYHWGMDIGPTNFVRPDAPEFTTLKWVPGIYFRHEGADR